MATPHVAGALSIALRARGLLVIDEMAAEKLRQETVANGGSVVTAGIVGDAKSPNNLLLSMVGLTGTRAPTAAPTNAPTETPTTAFPTSSPVEQPTASDAPTSTPTPVPTQAPTNVDSLSSCVNSSADQRPNHDCSISAADDIGACGGRHGHRRAGICNAVVCPDGDADGRLVSARDIDRVTDPNADDTAVSVAIGVADDGANHGADYGVADDGAHQPADLRAHWRTCVAAGRIMRRR
eukprot:PRCOL_00006818-RA